MSQTPFPRLADLIAEQWVVPFGVIHVGAHHGEETETYLSAGFGHVTLVEADPELAAELANRFSGNGRVTVIAAAVIGDNRRRVPFRRFAESMTSGLLPVPDRQPTAVVDVPATTLRDIQKRAAANVAVIDTQGTELEVLSAADLSTLDVVIIETTREPGSQPAASWRQVKRHMTAAGWGHVDDWPHPAGGYLDSIYIRQGRYEP